MAARKDKNRSRRGRIIVAEAPVFHPSDKDPSLGAPVFHPSDKDLSLGARFGKIAIWVR